MASELYQFSPFIAIYKNAPFTYTTDKYTLDIYEYFIFMNISFFNVHTDIIYGLFLYIAIHVVMINLQSNQ